MGMVSDKLAKLMAEATYDAICNRASAMATIEFPDLDNAKRLWLEAGIAAGVTATIKTLTEAGLLTSEQGSQP